MGWFVRGVLQKNARKQGRFQAFLYFFLIGQPFEVNKENGGCTLH